MLKIFIDADACPVKEDTYRVAKRYQLNVIVVANSPIVVPIADWIEMVTVASGFDAVDHWIVEKLEAGDIVITNDVLLAARCIEKGAVVVDPRGRVLDEDNIGEAVAHRELMAELRERGALNLGPKKMGKKQHSSFLGSLDTVINRQRNRRR